jgi:hypothetical protein
MTEFAVNFQGIDYAPSWRDKLRHIVKDNKKKTAMGA